MGYENERMNEILKKRLLEIEENKEKLNDLEKTICFH